MTGSRGWERWGWQRGGARCGGGTGREYTHSTPVMGGEGGAEVEGDPEPWGDAPGPAPDGRVVLNRQRRGTGRAPGRAHRGGGGAVVRVAH